MFWFYRRLGRRSLFLRLPLNEPCLVVQRQHTVDYSTNDKVNKQTNFDRQPSIKKTVLGCIYTVLSISCSLRSHHGNVELVGMIRNATASNNAIIPYEIMSSRCRDMECRQVTWPCKRLLRRNSASVLCTSAHSHLELQLSGHVTRGLAVDPMAVSGATCSSSIVGWLNATGARAS